MGEWKEVQLRNVSSDISYGYTASAADENVGPKFLRITDITSGRINWETVPFCKISERDLPKYKLGVGDIVIARTGATTGYNAIIKNQINAVYASYLIRFQIDKKLADPFFIGYVLQSNIFQDYVDAIAGGSAQPGANAQQFADFEFSLPSIPEQQSIASILSSLDDKIDLLHRQNKTLEQLAETLFRQWFVEETDEEWEKQSLGNLIELDRGISYRGDLLGEKGTGMPMHNLGSIDINGSYKFEGIKYYTGEVKEKQKLNAGDLLIINTDITQDNRIIGWPIFVPSIFIESTFTHHLYVAKLKTSSVSKFYLYFLLRYRDYRDALASNANGTTVSMLSKEAIYNIEIKIPPKNKREQFEMIANKILDKQTINQNQIRTLTQLRDTLLPKLMSGEVRLGS